MMKDNAWFSSIPRLITIIAAVAVYLLALVAVLRRSRKNKPVPKGKAEEHPTNYEGPERRIYPRAKLGIGVRYKPCSPEDGMQVFREGRAVDISEGGLLLEAPEKLAVDEKLEFKLKLPEISHFMLLRGIVVWVKEVEPNLWLYKCGISISEIDPNDRKQIAKYVASKQVHLIDNNKEVL